MSHKRGNLKVWNKRELWRDANKKCQSCHHKVALGAFQIHHIKPLSEGGTNNRKNLLVLCDDCHYAEHMKGGME
jgi:5-methylcytosine-specific restriction protein A